MKRIHAVPFEKLGLAFVLYTKQNAILVKVKVKGKWVATFKAF